MFSRLYHISHISFASHISTSLSRISHLSRLSYFHVSITFLTSLSPLIFSRLYHIPHICHASHIFTALSHLLRLSRFSHFHVSFTSLTSFTPLTSFTSCPISHVVGISQVFHISPVSHTFHISVSSHLQIYYNYTTWWRHVREWNYSSSDPYPRHWMEESGRLHAPVVHIQIKFSLYPWIKGWIVSTAGQKMFWIWETYQLPLPGIEPRFLGRHFHSLLTTLTELFRVTVQVYITIDKTRHIQE